MSDDDTTAARIEKLHELASMDEASLATLHDEGWTQWLIQFITLELPGTPTPSLNSAEDFVQCIGQLAGNKRAWSQRLGSLVIQQSDATTPEAEREAAAALKDFAASCPWKYLRESADRKL